MHIDVDQNPNIDLKCGHPASAPMISVKVIKRFANMDDQQARTRTKQLGEDAVHQCGNAEYVQANRLLKFLVVENQPAMDPQEALYMVSVKVVPYIIPFASMYTPETIPRAQRSPSP